MKHSKLLTFLVSTSAVLLLLALPVMSACGAQTETPTETPESTPTSTEVKKIKIGCMQSWTGSFAPSGLPIRNGFEIYVDKINEEGGITVNGEQYLIDPIYYDTRSDPKRAVSGILYLKELHDIKMVVGPTESNGMLAAQPIFEASNIFSVTTSSTPDLIRPSVRWTWRYSPVNPQRVVALVQVLKNVLDVKTISMVTENATTYQLYRNVLIPESEKAGISILDDVVVESTLSDFSTVIAKLRTHDPDIVFIFASGGRGILLLRQVYEAGWKVLLGISAEICNDETFKSCGPAANELIAMGQMLTYGIITSGKMPQDLLDSLGINMADLLSFGDRYEAKFGTRTGTAGIHNPLIGLSCYPQTIEKAGTFTDTAKMREVFVGSTLQSPVGNLKVLTNQNIQTFITTAVYFESTAANNLSILAYTTTTDDLQQNWVTIPVSTYDKISEIRKRRGY